MVEVPGDAMILTQRGLLLPVFSLKREAGGFLG